MENLPDKKSHIEESPPPPAAGKAQPPMAQPAAAVGLGPVGVYLRLVKFSHTAFALPFALLAAFLAGAGREAGFVRTGRFWAELALVLACMVSARSAAMAFNRIVDVRIDRHNPRTAGRPLQQGQLTLRQAWGFFFGCSGIFLACCIAFAAGWGNYWPILLALPVLGWLCLYSLTKRVTSLCHLSLGVALGLSPVSAWLAISPETFGPAAWALAAAVVCWVAGFDIIYSLQDLPYDLEQGLHSLPADLGPANALWISRSLHVTAVTALGIVWLLSQGRLGMPYLSALAAAAIVLLVEQILVSPRDFSRVNAAFFACNGAVSLLLGALGIVDILV